MNAVRYPDSAVPPNVRKNLGTVPNKKKSSDVAPAFCGAPTRVVPSSSPVFLPTQLTWTGGIDTRSPSTESGMFRTGWGGLNRMAGG